MLLAQRQGRRDDGKSRRIRYDQTAGAVGRFVSAQIKHQFKLTTYGDDVDFAPPPMQRHHNQPEEYEEEEPCHIEKGGTEVILSEI